VRRPRRVPRIDSRFPASAGRGDSHRCSRAAGGGRGVTAERECRAVTAESRNVTTGGRNVTAECRNVTAGARNVTAERDASGQWWTRHLNSPSESQSLAGPGAQAPGFRALPARPGPPIRPHQAAAEPTGRALGTAARPGPAQRAALEPAGTRRCRPVVGPSRPGGMGVGGRVGSAGRGGGGGGGGRPTGFAERSGAHATASRSHRLALSRVETAPERTAYGGNGAGDAFRRAACCALGCAQASASPALLFLALRLCAFSRVEIVRLFSR
jgi:hypothetical protein